MDFPPADGEIDSFEDLLALHGDAQVDDSECFGHRSVEHQRDPVAALQIGVIGR
jgi:hypothetical protein